jgi:amino acid adenylation domain-containing protein
MTLEKSQTSPLQAAMLRDTLAYGGRNIEQVEIVFSAAAALDRVLPAWLETVRETSALRMMFLFREGEPVGISETSTAPQIRKLDVFPSSFDEWLACDRGEALDLEGGLPWRVTFWPSERRFVWTFHHALLDGRSITRILRAFQARLTGNNVAEALELAVSRLPTATEIEAATAYHRRELARIEAAVPEFYQDQGGGPVRLQRSLGAEEVTRLEQAALAMGVTAASLLTWTWGQTVACAAGLDAVLVGQVRSGPPLPARAGFSMNTVPLVINRASGVPLKPVLLDFRRKLLEMRALETVSPQDLPQELFHETGGPWPGGVVMVERGSLHHQLGGTDCIESICLHEFSGEPLLASAWIQPELLLEVEASGAPFGAGTAQALLDHWASIVLAISADAGAPTELPVSNREILTSWESGGEPAAHLHLAQAWRTAVALHGPACALWTPEEAIRYDQLDAQVQHLAACLQEAGVIHGQTVASILWSRKHLAVVLLAMARIGAINVPLDPALPKNRQLTILEDASPLLVVSDNPAACADFSLPCVTVEGASGKCCSAELPCDPRDSLSILYTSGSTGKPKGVMMVHGGVTNEARGIASMAGIGPGDRLLQFASPGFDASLEELLSTLLSGATLVPRPENLAADLDEFQSFVRTAGITVLDLSTAHWAAWCAWMASEQVTIPDKVRTTIIGGERASAAALKDWFAAGGREHLLINTYGPTEASVVGTAELIQGDWNEAGDPAIGRPLPGVFARVGDSAGRRVPPGAAGELWLGGICVGPGYWQRPDRTAASFHLIDDRWWYRTGDRVCWDSNGKLRFLGRQDDQLKIRGNRIEPNEVIRVLESYPGVSAAHAGPVPGHGGGNQLAAWVRWNAPPEGGWPGKLAAFAAVHLPAAAIPTRWAAVEEFKLTERGKLDRRQLPEPLLTSSSHVSSEPPATQTEKWLAEVWSRLLGVRTIGRDESFFELGGHSLAALRLFASIASEWKLRIPMAVLIQAPTPRMLGGVIDRERACHSGSRPARSIVLTVRAEGDLPPLFCIHGGDGGVFFYRDLAEKLPSGRPLLAIESPALSADEETVPVPVEETAAAYVEALRQHQQSGPYHLAGYSYGGLLVIEIARRLLAEGESIAFAGLFDTINPAAPIRQYTLLERAEVFWDAQEHSGLLGKIGRMFVRTREGIATYFKVMLEIRAARSSEITEPHSQLRMLKVREAHWESMKSYQPAPLGCHITLFQSSATDDKFDIPDDYGWGPLVDSIEVVKVDGKHLTMFAPQHVVGLAREISKRLPVIQKSVA